MPSLRPDPSLPASFANAVAAAALNAVSLAHLPLSISSPPFPPPLSPTTSPLHIPLPLPDPVTPHTHTLYHAMRTLVHHLHVLTAAAQPQAQPYDRLPILLRALYPVVMSSVYLRHLMAHLNTVHFLLCATTIPTTADTASDSIESSHLTLALRVLRPLLRDPLARHRFRQANGVDVVLPLLHPNLAIAADLLADIIPYLPTAATIPLRSASALARLRLMLDGDTATITGGLRLLAAVLASAPPGEARRAVMRESNALAIAITYVIGTHTIPALRVVLAAVFDDVAAAAEFGVLASGRGLDVVLTACSTFLDNDQNNNNNNNSSRTNMDDAALLSNLVYALCKHQPNMSVLIAHGLCKTYVRIIPRLPPAALPRGLKLLKHLLADHESSLSTTLSTAVNTKFGGGGPSNNSNSERHHALQYPKKNRPIARNTDCKVTGDALVQALTATATHAEVQAPGLCLLASVLETGTSVPASLPRRAVRVAHFAMTQHATNRHVMAGCARVFLASPPAEISAAACPLEQLARLLRTRLRLHAAQAETADLLGDAIHALDIVVAEAASATAALAGGGGGGSGGGGGGNGGRVASADIVVSGEQHWKTDIFPKRTHLYRTKTFGPNNVTPQQQQLPQKGMSIGARWFSVRSTSDFSMQQADQLFSNATGKSRSTGLTRFLRSRESSMEGRSFRASSFRRRSSLVGQEEQFASSNVRANPTKFATMMQRPLSHAIVRDHNRDRSVSRTRSSNTPVVTREALAVNGYRHEYASEHIRHAQTQTQAQGPESRVYDFKRWVEARLHHSKQARLDQNMRSRTALNARSIYSSSSSTACNGYGNTGDVYATNSMHARALWNKGMGMSMDRATEVGRSPVRKRMSVSIPAYVPETPKDDYCWEQQSLSESEGSVNAWADCDSSDMLGRPALHGDEIDRLLDAEEAEEEEEDENSDEVKAECQSTIGFRPSKKKIGRERTGVVEVDGEGEDKEEVKEQDRNGDDMVNVTLVDRVRPGERQREHRRGKSVLGARLSLGLGMVDSDTWSGPKTHSHTGPDMGAKNGCAVGVDVGSSDCDDNASRRFAMDVRGHTFQARAESGSLSVGR